MWIVQSICVTFHDIFSSDRKKFILDLNICTLRQMFQIQGGLLSNRSQFNMNWSMLQNLFSTRKVGTEKWLEQQTLVSISYWSTDVTDH